MFHASSARPARQQASVASALQADFVRESLVSRIHAQLCLNNRVETQSAELIGTQVAKRKKALKSLIT
jgi:hypothetical protein